MHVDTGRFSKLEEGEKPKPMEILFQCGEEIKIKGQPFKVQRVDTERHEIILRSAKYKPSAKEASEESTERYLKNLQKEIE